MLQPLNITVLDLFKNTVKNHPDSIAYCQGETAVSWKKTDEYTNYIAASLAKRGVKHGSHIGIMATENLGTFLFILAALKTGAVCVMFNATLSETELRELAEFTGVEFFAAGGTIKESLLENVFLSSNLDIPHINVFSLSDYSDHFTNLGNLLFIGQTIYRNSGCTFTPPAPQDNAFILFTSGTTSSAKAVPITHLMLANTASLQAEDLNYTHKDKVCSTLPVSHCFCICVNFVAALSKGACLALPEKRNSTEIINTLKNGCTVLNAVPAMFLKLIEKGGFKKSDLSLRIGIIGGDSYDIQTFKHIENSFGMTLMSSLGQTECTAGITICYPADSVKVRATTVGHFMENTKGVIRSVSTNEILPCGQVGEICVKGFGVMNGYYKSPQLTAQVVDSDGYFHTGDLGYMDECGNLHYRGRIKNMIIRGGENISPLEIETALRKTDLPIKDVSIIGVPSSRYGEEIAMCVVTDNNTKLTQKQVADTLKHKIACYKVPAYICHFDELPRTSSGKIKKHLLKKAAIEQLNSPQ